MLAEKSREEALKAFGKGKRVIVITEFITGGVGEQTLEELLPEDGVHYLVDVPAVDNPEFEQAVREMVEAGDWVGRSGDAWQCRSWRVWKHREGVRYHE